MEALCQGLLHPDWAVPVRASIGLRLPWILGHDEERQVEWIELLFGPAVDQEGRDACWQAYLLYSRLFGETVGLLDRVDLEAVNTFEATCASRTVGKSRLGVSPKEDGCPIPLLGGSGSPGDPASPR